MRTNGILGPHAIGEQFTLARHAPSPALAAFVERFWIVRWDLRGRAPHEQATLPYPCVNFVIGTHRPGVFGPATARFVARLEDHGWVVGTKFKPAGFRAFTRTPMADLVDAERSIAAVFGAAGTAVERDVHALADDRARIECVEAFLCACAPVADPEAAAVDAIVALAESERAIVRVADLAARARLPVRTLERLFRRHVGVTPKWVIRRFRVHEAAARADAGSVVDWSELAHELGFFDQAHFIREFKAQVGRTPGEYVAR